MQTKPLAVVLFDGAGLAAKGLRAAGYRTIGVELNPVAHRLACAILSHETGITGDASSTTIEADVRSPRVRQLLRVADLIWASPPCQALSSARTQGPAQGDFAENLLQWSLGLATYYNHCPVIVENVTRQGRGLNDWGRVYNAHQFGTDQNRNRVFGGRYTPPAVEREYRRAYPGICPCITATEYKGCATDTRRASRFYGRRLTLWEMGHHMDLPPEYVDAMRAARPDGWTVAAWDREVCRAIGNGVPIRMAEAFGRAQLHNTVREAA